MGYEDRKNDALSSGHGYFEPRVGSPSFSEGFSAVAEY
jgi:hypothetical protein